jgi:hypothetical protein
MFQRFPIITHFFLAVGLTLAGLYVGNLAGGLGGYVYERHRVFASLDREQGRDIRTLNESLLASTLSHIMTKNTKESLQSDLSNLQKLRLKAPPDALPLLDLRMAADHASLARLYQSTNDSANAIAQREMARPLLRELGWTDTSDEVLNQVADKRFRPLNSKISSKGAK